MAWFLAGLSHAALVVAGDRWPLGDLAGPILTTGCQDNRGQSGLFGHLAPTKSLSRICVDAWVTLPIKSIQFMRCRSSPPPSISRSRSTLHSNARWLCVICRETWANGGGSTTLRPGEWLVSYPVYSVDQYGLAPLALFELERATGRSFQDAICRGLDWVYGANELGDCRTSSRELIWRCIVPRSRQRKYWETARSFIRPNQEHVAAESLHVLHESRSVGLGMLLCSFAKHGIAEKASPLISVLRSADANCSVFSDTAHINSSRRIQEKVNCQESSVYDHQAAARESGKQSAQDVGDAPP